MSTIISIFGVFSITAGLVILAITAYAIIEHATGYKE